MMLRDALHSYRQSSSPLYNAVVLRSHAVTVKLPEKKIATNLLKRTGLARASTGAQVVLSGEFISERQTHPARDQILGHSRLGQ